MMFSCCHPRLSEEAQVALVLHILCGFSIDEVAGAFVSSHAAIEKRIQRSKKILAGSKKLFDVTAQADFALRLPAVQRALYLLFSEGYHGASAEFAVRIELCHEAMRLVARVMEHPQGATPATCALSALMCLNAARLPARVDNSGNLCALSGQDRSLWDQNLVMEGMRLLELSATGSALSSYHLEAAIASLHAAVARTEDTNWEMIVSLYDSLFALHPTPIVALNRAIAVGQLSGPERGLEEMAHIENRDRLIGYPFYFAALGELELGRRRYAVAREHFAVALALARNPAERRFTEQRLIACDTESSPTQVCFGQPSKTGA
jgi:RNA polymerase sigma-70 factor (ECF subfamily)